MKRNNWTGAPLSGGKKHNWTGMSFDDIMRQQVQQSADKPVYCRFCGLNVKEPTAKSPGGAGGSWNKYLDWETDNHSHVSCANQHTGGRRR